MVIVAVNLTHLVASARKRAWRQSLGALTTSGEGLGKYIDSRERGTRFVLEL